MKNTPFCSIRDRAAIACVIALCVLGACAPVRSLLSSDQQPTYDALLVEEAKAKDAVAADQAKLAANPTDQGASDQLAVDSGHLAEVKSRVDSIEGEAIRNTYGPTWTAITSLPVVGPWANALGPLGALVLGIGSVPMASKNGRGNYAHAVKALTPGVGTAAAGGSKSVHPIVALKHVGKALVHAPLNAPPVA